MWSKAKTGALLGAVTAVLSIGSLGVYAATPSQTATVQDTKKVDWFGQHKGWFNKDHKLGAFAKGQGFGLENNTELLSLLNVDADTLKQELKAGKSLADIAKEKGVAEDDVIALLTKQEETRLADAVKNGKLTQEKADEIKAKLADRIKQIVERTKPEGFKGPGHGFGLENNTELLSLLNVDADTLKQELKAGKSLADIAKEKGVAEDDVIALLTKQEETRLADAVKNGKLTQDQANSKKEKFEELVKAFVEHKFGQKQETQQQ